VRAAFAQEHKPSKENWKLKPRKLVDLLFYYALKWFDPQLWFVSSVVEHLVVPLMCLTQWILLDSWHIEKGSAMSPLGSLELGESERTVFSPACCFLASKTCSSPGVVCQNTFSKDQLEGIILPSFTCPCDVPLSFN